jgi:predicted nuclease of predicted toxin-antitoxin system
MKILFDQGTPAPLRRHLAGHVVDTAHEKKWSNLSNGDLLDEAVRNGYQLLITTDQNLRYQQNLADRQLAIIVLLSTSWPRIRLRISDIQAAVNAITFGDYVEIPI